MRVWLSYQVALVQAVLDIRNRPVQRTSHFILRVEHAVVREQADVEVSAVGGEAELQRIFIDSMVSGDGSLVDLVISGY